MKAQEHIDALGAAVTDLEDAVKASKQAARAVAQKTKALHDALEVAQTAYMDTHAPDGDVTAFSGGNEKPPVDDPDEPVP